MLKIYVILLALIHSNVYASLISPSTSKLTNSNYILSLNNQQYAQKYHAVSNLIKSNKLEKAKLALVFLLTQDPNDPIALDISGNILLAENKLHQALNAFQRALSSNQSPEIMAKIGVCHLLVKDHEKAKLWLTQSLSLSPNNELALRYLAWLEEQSFNQSAQHHYLSQLVKLSDEKSALYEYHLKYLALLIDNNNVDEGLSFIEKNKDKFPTSQKNIVNNIQLIEIELLLKANNITLAKEKYKQFATSTIEEDVAINHSLLSIFYYASLKNYKKAESIIQAKFSENKLAKSIADYSLAKVYFDHQDYESAHNKLLVLFNDEKTTRKKMNYVDDIVANYSVQSRYGDAIKFLKKQIEVNSTTPQYQHQLAELYIISGRAKAANTQLDFVINNFPDYAPSYIVKARQLVKKSEPQATIDFFNVALKKHPGVPELWLDFAKFYFNNGQPVKSLSTLEKANAANEGNPFLTFELAAMYDNQNLLAKSEPLYIKVLQNYPEYLPALDNLASNFFTLDKNLDIAIVLAKRAFLLSPNDIYIKNLRAQAYIIENKSTEAIALLSPVLNDFKESGLGEYTLANAYNKTKQHTLAHKKLALALTKELPENIRKKALALQKEWVTK